jgi:hypothetical protein
VAGAIALSTCICFVFAICLMPGVCIGIVGYKRYDPENFGISAAAAAGSNASSPSKQPKKGGSKQVHDPYAAGLAERPRHDAMGNTVDPYAGSGGGTIAMPPDEEVLQMNPALAAHAMSQSGGHRSSLMMALASSPEADPSHVQLELQPVSTPLSPQQPFSPSAPPAEHDAVSPSGIVSPSDGSRVYEYHN